MEREEQENNRKNVNSHNKRQENETSQRTAIYPHIKFISFRDKGNANKRETQE